LIEVTQASWKQAQKFKSIIGNLNLLQFHQLLQRFEIFLPRISQVIEQTQRRIFNLEKVPAAEKIVSIFESHTYIICRGKINVDVEFGHKVWLDEIDGGIVSNYRILKGNPHDTQQLVPSLDQHVENFGSSPKIVTTDRGVYS
jgi:transposase, IS5 family